MDSSTPLDYALFQLTPTRTRCDLVIFCGGKSERLAHGLLEPFLSHLKFAKDEISKGGYSITLRPPTSRDASWFTKATFQRFVRFISTPEILERFIALEREISQIESSVQANELEKAHVSRQGEQGSPTASNGNSVKSSDSSKGEIAENEDAVQEENSRVRLQRLLETRRAMLLRSQAMAYARALAAGFDMDNMDELIAFSDTFGASRLREACVEFKELCKRKQSDIPWMEELSAMEAYSSPELSFPATSGIILTNEMNCPANHNNLLPNGSPDASKQETNCVTEGKNDDNKIQMQIPWPNQFPPYMYPMHQMPPYPGYPFPIMAPNGLNDPRWAFSSEGAHQDLKGESKLKSKSLKKERNLHKEEEDLDSEEDSQTASSESEGEKRRSSTEQSQRKKHRKKKNSKTVVIRNINYIASKDEEKDGPSGDSSSSSEDEFSLKKKIEEAVGVFKKNHKSKRHTNKKDGSNHMTEHEEETEDTGTPVEKSSTKNWDAFQNLLMRDEKEPNLNPQRPFEDSQDEHFVIRSFGDEVSDGIQKVIMQRKVTDDSLVMAERSREDETNGKSIDFRNGENTRPVLRRRGFADDAMMLSGNFEGSENLHNPLPDSNADSSLARTQRSEDGFIINGTLKLESGDVNVKQVIFDGDYLDNIGKSRKDPQVDDSFMIQDRTSLDDSRDMSMFLEYMSSSQMENAANVEASVDEHRGSSTYEPDDLCVVLERDDDVGSNRLSWTTGYDVDFSMAEAEKSPAKQVTDKTPDSSDGKTNSGKKKELSAGKDARQKVVNRSPVGKSKPEAISRVRKPTLMNRTAAQKSKFEKEEEVRKRMEEMLLERQRRIAERTAASGTATPVKRSPVESRTAKASIKTERAKPQNPAVRV